MPEPAAAGPRIAVTVDGAPWSVPAGASIAAAFTGHGTPGWRRTRRRAEPRGLSCGIGVCFDCLVTVNGVPGVRACLVQARDGDVITTEKGPDLPNVALEPAARPAAGPASWDLAVIGAGPAGMTAAVEAADAGCRAVVLDLGERPGGQYWRWGPATGDGRYHHGWPAFAALLGRFTAHQAAGRIGYRPGHAVFSIEPSAVGGTGGGGTGGGGAGVGGAGGGGAGGGGAGGGGAGGGGAGGDGAGGGGAGGGGAGGGRFRVHAVAGGGAGGGRFRVHAVADDRRREYAAVEAAAVVVATGAYDRQLPVPGWTLPGVMAAGAAQSLLKGSAVVAGRRVVVAGAGPFLLPVAAGLARAGARVVAVIEAGQPLDYLRRPADLAASWRKLPEAAGYLAELARHRVPVLRRHAVIAAHGEERLRSVTVARIDAAWAVVRGSGRTLDADVLAVGYGFIPQVELLGEAGAQLAAGDGPGAFVALAGADQQTTVPGLFAAGETTGVGGADLARIEGAAAGRAAARYAGHPVPRAGRGTRRARRARAALARFAAVMESVHAVQPGWARWPAEETVICRCEEVTLGELRTAIGLGADDARSAKLLARPGMGWCQGRMCGHAVSAIIAAEGGRSGPRHGGSAGLGRGIRRAWGRGIQGRGIPAGRPRRPLPPARSPSPSRSGSWPRWPRTAPPRTAPPRTAPPRTAPPRTAPPRTAPGRTVPPRTAPPRTAPAVNSTGPNISHVAGGDVVPTKSWHGVLVATALPYHADLSVDFDRYAEHVAWLAASGCDGITPNGSLGEYQVLTPQERTSVVEAAVAAAPAGFSVIPGVAAYGAREAAGWAEAAAKAGADAVMLLPPNSYRADERTVIDHYRAVAAVGLPIVAYNNPIDTKVDLVPALLARLFDEGLIVAVKEFTGDPRRAYEIAELAAGLDVLIGSDDSVLEFAVAGAKGWVSGFTNVFPRTCAELYRACTALELEAARELYRLLHPLLRWDAKSEFVQAIKLSMDMAGPGGPCRPPRLALTPEQEAVVRHATQQALDRGLHLMRARRVFHAVDSHTEGMPTRVVVGGVGAIPGATMFERRRYFMTHLDGIRRALMYEPRGHAAMSGAILQPPARPDADWGVVFIEVSGCLPMCGHGTIGVATVLVETGMVEVTEPVTRVALDTPAGLVIADVAVRDGVARSVSLRNVPAFTLGLDQEVPVEGTGPVTYDMAFGGNFYAILDLEQVGLPFDRAYKNQILSAGLDLMAAINKHNEPVHPGNPEIRGCHHVQFLAPGADARHSRHAMAIYPGWFDRSPCGTGTSARLAQLHARGQIEVGAELINESFIGSRFTGSIVEETAVRDTPAVIPKITGRAWITGTAQYVIAPDDPFPEGFQL